MLLAALDLLVGILQQHTKRPDTPEQGSTMERGVTEDEHSAALKLFEVRACCLHQPLHLHPLTHHKTTLLACRTEQHWIWTDTEVCGVMNSNES